MSSDGKQILLVAGDYDVVQVAQQALKGQGFNLQTAFSTYDSTFALEKGEFDAVIVDGAMTDRRTGEPTITAIIQLARCPVIAYAGNLAARSGKRTNAHKSANSIINDLKTDTLKQALRHVLEGAPAPQSIAQEALTDRSPQLQTLFHLSKSLTEVLDLGEVLNRIVEAARRLTHADEGLLLLPDDDKGQLYLRARVGMDINIARNFRIKTNDTLAGQVFTTGAPILISQSGPLKVKTEYFVKSMLYVPIQSQDRIIGVLGVNNREKEDDFTAEQQELLLNLASYAAVAIENARAHEDSIQRARELEALVQASEVVNSSLSLDKTLPNVADQLMRVLNVNLVAITDWHADTRHLALRACHYRAFWRSKYSPIIPLNDVPGLTAAARNSRALWLNIEDDADAAGAYLNERGVGALLAVPIHLQDKLAGVMFAYYVRPPENPPAADVVQRFRASSLEVLSYMVGQSGEASSQGLLRILETMRRTVTADWVEICLPLTDVQLSVRAAVGTGVWLDAQPALVDVRPYPDVIKALEEQTVLTSQVPRGTTSSLVNLMSSRSFIGVPMVYRGRTQGFILVADTLRGERTFSKRDTDLARTIVSHATTALENAHLVHDLEKSLRDLRDAQDRLVETARLSAMGELAAAVAHQLNNPLTTIVVDTELLLLDEHVDSKKHQALDAILRTGKRAANVARRLLAISRSSQHEDAPPAPVDVEDTLRGVLSLVKSHLERAHIQVQVNLPSDPLPPVYAVPGQLDDIWLNLILNAHDALVGCAKPQIRVDMIADEQFATVFIRDNGPGIPTAIQAKIFEPFFTTKPVGEGTGLGLHICRQVIERVGGSIEVDSAPGKGACFVVQLPFGLVQSDDD